MTKQAEEIWEILHKVTQTQQETALDLMVSRENSEKERIKAEKRSREIDKQLKELGKQIGSLGKKFGSFTEGLALPSMTKILREKFHMEVISPSVRVSKNNMDVEIDVLAYANSNINEAYVVEVKSHLREEGISQLKEIMANFRLFFPEHKDKKVYGIIAAVDISEALKKRVLEAGFYVARIKDDSFSLAKPKAFEAKVF